MHEARGDQAVRGEKGQKAWRLLTPFSLSHYLLETKRLIHFNLLIVLGISNRIL